MLAYCQLFVYVACCLFTISVGVLIPQVIFSEVCTLSCTQDPSSIGVVASVQMQVALANIDNGWVKKRC